MSRSHQQPGYTLDTMAFRDMSSNYYTLHHTKMTHTVKEIVLNQPSCIAYITKKA